MKLLLQKPKSESNKLGKAIDTLRQSLHANTAFNLSPLLQWEKKYDCKTNLHTYVNANPLHLRKFFRLREDALSEVIGKTDIDLLNDYRKRTGKRHTYGELCLSTDEFSRDQAIRDHREGKYNCSYEFIEMGVIDDSPLVLRVIKQPIFKNPACCECCEAFDGYCANIGIAENISYKFNSTLETLDSQLESGEAVKLSAGVFWVKNGIDRFDPEWILKQIES